MKNIFLTLLLCFFIACPSYAQSVDLPSLAQSQFLNSYTSQGLTGCNSNADHGLQFAPGTSQANIAAVTAAAASFDWTGASLKLPDIVGFFTAIATDQNLPSGARTQLPLTMPLMQINVGNPALMNNYVADMVTSGAYPYLSTLPAITEVLSLAAQYNIPIQAPTVPAGTPNLTGFKLTVLQDATIPLSSKLHLLTYASTITDLIGYANTTNPASVTSAAMAAGTSVQVGLSTVDATLAPGVFVVVTDGTNSEVSAVIALATVDSVTTATLSSLANSYASGAQISVCNPLSQAWVGIATSDPAVVGVNCLDGTPLAVKINSIAVANGIHLYPI